MHSMETVTGRYLTVPNIVEIKKNRRYRRLLKRLFTPSKDVQLCVSDFSLIEYRLAKVK